MTFLRLIFVFFALLHFAIFSYGQEKIYPVENDNNKHSGFESLIQNLSSDFNIEFAFESGIRVVDFNPNYSKNLGLPICLQNIFKDSNIEYLQSGNTILLRNTKHIEDQEKKVKIRGKIYDIFSETPLPYVNISDGQGRYFTSDTAGRYQLSFSKKNLPDSLYFSFVGYDKTKLKTNFSGAELQVKMNPGINRIPLIKILSVHQKQGSLLLRSKGHDVLKSFGSGISNTDILRNIQLIAGVDAHQDLSTQIRIRGSEAYETMIELDGMVLYNPSHFYNIFSAISDDYVGKTEVFMNSLPINYSGRTAGLIKMQSKDAGKSGLNALAQIDLFQASLLADIPITGHSALLFSGRSSYTAPNKNGFIKTLSFNNSTKADPVLKQNLIQALDPDFKYYDINAKYQFKSNNDLKIDLNFYNSRDQLNNVERNTISPFSKITNYLFDYSDQSEWSNIGVSGIINFKAFTKTISKITLSYSQSEFFEDFSFQHEVETKNDNRDFRFYNTLSNQIQDFHFKWDNLSKINSKLNFNFGLEGAHYHTGTYISSNDKDVMQRDLSEKALSIYQELEGFEGLFSWSIGSRINYLANKNKLLLDPRIYLQYLTQEGKGKIYTSLAYNNQYLFQFDYENQLGQNYSFWSISDDQIPILNSLNYTLGYQYKIEDFRFGSEAYIKSRKNISEFSLLKPGYSDDASSNPGEEYRLFFGSGLIFGLDLSVTKKWGNYESLINYTISKNLVSFPNIFGGKYFTDKDHRTHQLKWLNSYFFKRMSINTNFIYSSGKAYFDFSNLDRTIGRKNLDRDKLLNYLPYYFRLDAGINYILPFKGKKITFGLSVFNLTNRQNLYQLQNIKPAQINGSQSEFLPVGYEQSLLQRTVNFSLKLEL